MAFNFPNVPNLGDLFQPVGGPVYQWDGQKWVMAGSPLQVTPAYANRNRICNPAMQISQENGNTAGTAISYYYADQWNGFGNITGGASHQRVQVTTPNGSLNRARFTVTTGWTVPGSSGYGFQQKVEGIRFSDLRYGSSAAVPSVIRFGFKAPAGTYALVLLEGSTNNRTYLASFTISAAQANTDTVQTFAIPGDTAGTWVTGAVTGVYLIIILASDAGAQGVAGWQAGSKWSLPGVSNTTTTNSVFELFDVGWYANPTGSGIPPAWEMPDEAAELYACQRYWNQWGGEGSAYATIGIGQAYSTTANVVVIQLSPPMRVAPTVSSIGAFGCYNAGAGVLPVTSLALSQSGARSYAVTANVASGLVGGNASGLFTNNDVNARLRLSARM